MTEDLEFETYLFISLNEFEIYLFDKKKLKNLYKEKLNFENNSKNIDLITLNNFLDKNIFKIEKLIGKFIKNIFLIIEIKETLNINLSIKKKNYDQIINKKNFENSLIEAKDIFNESFQDKKIMHIIITKYTAGNNSHLSYIDNLSGDSYCLEIQFKSISKEIILQLDKILKKYQIQISCCLDGEYIKIISKMKKWSYRRWLTGYKTELMKMRLNSFQKMFQKLVFLKSFFNYLVNFVFYRNISCFLFKIK